MTWSLLVVVPARNEEQLIGRCVESVQSAIAATAQGLRSTRLVIVADRCDDRTVAVARRTAADASKHSNGHDHRTVIVSTSATSVGDARATGAESGRELLSGTHPETIWLANTDADTVVPATWIDDQLRWATAGFHAVAGTVDVDTFTDYPPGHAQRFHRHYTALLPAGDDDHSHVHAANMGIRLDAYLSVGGWAKLPRSEDRDLWMRLVAGGYRTRSPASLRVLTSGRKHNRIENGFADSLVALLPDESESTSAA